MISNIIIKNRKNTSKWWLVNKVLSSLQPKVTAIQEAKYLKTLSFSYLLFSLITHKMMIGEDPSKKRKGFAFKASI